MGFVMTRTSRLTGGKRREGMNIEIEFEQESDGRWIADVPAISGAIAYGAAKKEAFERVIAILKESGEKELMNAARGARQAGRKRPRPGRPIALQVFPR
jgi:predicted RNase H-like HicB family nuclease